MVKKEVMWLIKPKALFYMVGSIHLGLRASRLVATTERKILNLQLDGKSLRENFNLALSYDLMPIRQAVVNVSLIG